MPLVRQVPAVTWTALAIFAVAALFLAPTVGGNIDRLIICLVVEVPLLLIVAGIGLLIINLIAAYGGAAFGGSALVAAAIAALLAWAIAGGYPSFSGLGYHFALRPAYAIAIAVPWLSRANLAGLMRGHRS